MEVRPGGGSRSAGAGAGLFWPGQLSDPPGVIGPQEGGRSICQLSLPSTVGKGTSFQSQMVKSETNTLHIYVFFSSSFSSDKVAELIAGGSVINRAYPI